MLVYAAKAAGRNGFIYWQEMSAEAREDVSRFASELGNSAAVPTEQIGRDVKRKGTIAA